MRINNTTKHQIKIAYLYCVVSLPVVSSVCQTFSLTLKQELRLGEFKNRVLMKIFKPMREGVRGDWRKLLSDKLHDMYCSPNIIRVIQ
jgi:hypothetical protein